MENVSWNSIIKKEVFNCMCRGCTETMENDEKVLILTCGCLFKKRCLESSHIRQSFKKKTLEWIKTSIPDEIGGYTCGNPECNITPTFTVQDLVTNNRYNNVFEKAQKNPKQSLKEISGFDNKHFAFVPTSLVEVYQGIIKKQREKKWQGKNWPNFKAAIREIEDRIRHGTEWQTDPKELAYMLQLKRETEERWLGLVNEKLIRIPAYPRQQWTYIKWSIYIGRAVYHGVLATVWQLGLSVFKFFNFISVDTFNTWQENEVGYRLTELFLEYYGMHYNYARPQTVENRLWSWIKREDRRTIEW